MLPKPHTHIKPLGLTLEKYCQSKTRSRWGFTRREIRRESSKAANPDRDIGRWLRQKWQKLCVKCSTVLLSSSVVASEGEVMWDLDLLTAIGASRRLRRWHINVNHLSSRPGITRKNPRTPLSDLQGTNALNEKASWWVQTSESSQRFYFEAKYHKSRCCFSKIYSLHRRGHLSSNLSEERSFCLFQIKMQPRGGEPLVRSNKP